MTALQTSPIMPVTQKQRGLIGDTRADASNAAQLSARGLKKMLPAVSIRREPFVYWTPERYNDRSISSSTWAAEATHDVNAGCLKCGNHECRRDVCYKGRIGKQGFCRMLFWHWGLYTDKKNQSRARHAHGQLLQPRWDGKKKSTSVFCTTT